MKKNKSYPAIWIKQHCKDTYSVCVGTEDVVFFPITTLEETKHNVILINNFFQKLKEAENLLESYTQKELA